MATVAAGPRSTRARAASSSTACASRAPARDSLGPAAVAALAACAAFAVALQGCGADWPGDDLECGDVRGEESEAGRAGGFAMDGADADAMHAKGLPSRGDVLAWHYCGWWGFTAQATDGTDKTMAGDELPGGAWVWDELYGLPKDDPTYRYYDEGVMRDEA